MQKRPPPAYQEYASSIISTRAFKFLNFAEKGLLWHIRLECWINGSLPSDSGELSALLGGSKDEISELLKKIKPMIKISKAEIRCPDLDDYREHLEAISLTKSTAGKASAKAREVAKHLLNTCSTHVQHPFNTLSIVQSSSATSSISNEGKGLKSGEPDEIAQLFPGGTT